MSNACRAPGEAELVVVVGGVGAVDDLQNAHVAAAVSCDLLAVTDLDGGPGQVVEGGVEAGLVPFREQDVVAAVFAQVGGVGALCVECVLCRPPAYADAEAVGAGHDAARVGKVGIIGDIRPGRLGRGQGLRQVSD
ncbi:MAG: hypothetical protein ACRDRK_17295 [Pseudonocardia sp.]